MRSSLEHCCFSKQFRALGVSLLRRSGGGSSSGDTPRSPSRAAPRKAHPRRSETLYNAQAHRRPLTVPTGTRLNLEQIAATKVQSAASRGQIAASRGSRTAHDADRSAPRRGVRVRGRASLEARGLMSKAERSSAVFTSNEPRLPTMKGFAWESDTSSVWSGERSGLLRKGWR